MWAKQTPKGQPMKLLNAVDCKKCCEVTSAWIGDYFPFLETSVISQSTLKTPKSVKVGNVIKSIYKAIIFSDLSRFKFFQCLQSCSAKNPD